MKLDPYLRPQKLTQNGLKTYMYKALIKKTLYTHSFVYAIFNLHNYDDHCSDVIGPGKSAINSR